MYWLLHVWRAHAEPIRQYTVKICLRLHCHFAGVLLQEHTFNVRNIPYAQFLCHSVTWKLTKGDY